MAGRSGLEELELTGEEAERLRRAFADEGFRRLFAEYAAELADPAQRAVYEAEVAALERARGVEARFLHPTPGWVLRTSQAGARRCYLNVCGCALVGRPEARPAPGGARWALPHCLAPGREEPGRRPGAPARPVVYDVLFHPEALGLAARSARFRRLLDETALDAVEQHFAPGLDRANAAPLRGAAYKGVPRAALLRTPLPGPPPGEEGPAPLPPFPTPYAYPPPPPAEAPARPPPAEAPPAATPRWTLRQRSYVDLQDYRRSRDSAPSPVPRELEVAVELPLLRSAAQARLEVRGRELRLDSPRPAAYRLRLPLPYPVDEDAGRAAFDRSARRLVVTLPVRRRPPEPAAPPPGPEPAPPEGSRAEPADDLGQPPSTSLQPCPAAHVGANHVELPVCPQESGPGALGAGESAPTCPAPLHVRLGSTPEQVPPEASSLSLEAATCDKSPGSGAPEGATCARDDKCPEAACVSLAPEVCVGSRVELPACPGVTGPSQEGLGADMDLRQGPEVANAVPSSDLGDATMPSVHLCGVSSDLPVTPECHSLSKPDQKTETCTSRGGSGYPGSCSNPEAPACSNAAPSTDLSVTAGSAASSPRGSPLLSGTGLGADPEAALIPSCSPDTPLPTRSPPPPLCPPFQCTQDEEGLILLLQVPGIVSQSLKGEVGTHQYRVSFVSKDLVSYTLFLQLPAENKLTSPETSISVSLDNAVIHLTKAPETAGLWTKLYFGLSEDAVQEKLFVTEDNVIGFLDSLPRPSCPPQAEMERQPSIEVLDVSESRSRIRLKAREHKSPEAGETPEKVNPGLEDGEHPCRTESLPLAPDSAAEHATHSLPAAETKEPAGRGPCHCLEPDPADSGLSAPGRSQIRKLQESELAFATDPRAAAPEQTQPDRAQPAGTREEIFSGSAERGSPAAPVLRETDPRDGSVQLISHHATHCPFTFQNPLLYELD